MVISYFLFFRITIENIWKEVIPAVTDTQMEIGGYHCVRCTIVNWQITYLLEHGKHPVEGRLNFVELFQANDLFTLENTDSINKDWFGGLSNPVTLWPAFKECEKMFQEFEVVNESERAATWMKILFVSNADLKWRNGSRKEFKSIILQSFNNLENFLNFVASEPYGSWPVRTLDMRLGAPKNILVTNRFYWRAFWHMFIMPWVPSHQQATSLEFIKEFISCLAELPGATKEDVSNIIKQNSLIYGEVADKLHEKIKRSLSTRALLKHLEARLD